MRSLPLRERGLKLYGMWAPHPSHLVAPLAGAWVEMAWTAWLRTTLKVAPLAGAWVEIQPCRNLYIPM